MWEPRAAGRRPRGDPARRAGPAAHRRDAAHLRLLPRRLPGPRRPARRRRRSSPRRSTSPPTENPSAPPAADDARLWGPPPGGYGSGILPLIEQRHVAHRRRPRRVYIAWSGFAYGRDGHGVPTADAMRRRFAAIDVAVKNQDNREHDIFDSDDYLQDHGGMVATIRSLTGSRPEGLVRRLRRPGAARVSARCAEEAARVVRTPVVNPKWIEAMHRHGYKGAFEMAATVDYLFGYDATAHVVEDWMYERVTDAYVADPEVRKFFEQSNPWALRSIAERLLEADEREHVGRVRRGAQDTASRRARGRGLGGGAVTDRPCSRSSAGRRPGRRQARAAPRRVEPRARRRAAAGPEGLGQDHARPRPRRAARRRAVRRAAARRHRGPRRRLARPRAALLGGESRFQPGPARRRRRRRALRRRDQPARRPPRRRAARRRGLRREPSSSATACRTAIRPASCSSAR